MKGSVFGAHRSLSVAEDTAIGDQKPSEPQTSHSQGYRGIIIYRASLVTLVQCVTCDLLKKNHSKVEEDRLIQKLSRTNSILVL